MAVGIVYILRHLDSEGSTERLQRAAVVGLERIVGFPRLVSRGLRLLRKFGVAVNRYRFSAHRFASLNVIKITVF